LADFTRAAIGAHMERKTGEVRVWVVSIERRDDAQWIVSVHSSHEGALRAAREAGAEGDGKDAGEGVVCYRMKHSSGQVVLIESALLLA